MDYFSQIPVENQALEKTLRLLQFFSHLVAQLARLIYSAQIN